jgi:hypothetical protein
MTIQRGSLELTPSPLADVRGEAPAAPAPARSWIERCAAAAALVQHAHHRAQVLFPGKAGRVHGADGGVQSLQAPARP